MSALSLREILTNGDPSFGSRLREESRKVDSFSEVMALRALRLRAQKSGALVPVGQPFRIAVVGGMTLRPLADLVEHFVAAESGSEVTIWTGEYDSYVSEILDPHSALHSFGPTVVIVLPSERRCRFQGDISDTPQSVQNAVDRLATELVDLARSCRASTGADVVLANFRLPGSYDPGSLRSTSLTSDYAFVRSVNTAISQILPQDTYICDCEFISNRLGLVASEDDRAWYESKQPGSVQYIVHLAKEIARSILAFRIPPKKVAILDLDNTLWGGVVGDDGVEGIEIGTTSPRGEAFRAFQAFLLSLKRRGVLLAVASKNDDDKAREPFETHPEMLIRLTDLASFKANWEPKSENIRQMATELSLGLDSFVFLDDNPAEIEIVRQFVPEVSGICLGDDPATFIDKVASARLFEQSAITQEDLQRTDLYRQESERQALKYSATDMDSYLESLNMVATIAPFNAIDAPRIAQLINKSNQFNLTTKRRSIAEVHELLSNDSYECVTIRLADRFGDHGLIAIVILRIETGIAEIDTWLMSCRVLKRQVEDMTLGEIARLASRRGCDVLVGRYIPTPKNEMVSEHYAKLGFDRDRDDFNLYRLDLGKFVPPTTHITQHVDPQ